MGSPPSTFEQLFLKSPLPAGVTRAGDGRVLAVNDAWLKWMERDRDSVVGRTTLELGLWKSKEARDAFLSQDLATPSALLQIDTPDGVAHWVRLHISRHTDEHGTDLLLTLVTIEDREQQVQQERDLKARELHEQLALHRETETLARVGYWTTALSSTEVFWSRGLYEIAGLEPDDAHLSREVARNGIHPDDWDEWESARNALDGRQVEYRWKRPDGEVRWLRTRMRRATIGDSAYDAAVGVVQDITAERTAMAALADQLRFIHNLAARVPGMMFQIRTTPDQKSSFTYLSNAAREMTELEPADLQRDGMVMMSNMHPEDRELVRAAMRAAVRQNTRYRQVVRMLLPRQGLRWFSVEASHETEPDGTVVWHGYASDVTDSRLAAQALDRQHRMLDAVRQAQATFIGSDNRLQAFDRLLESMQLLTRSSFGFIGEVLHDEQGKPYLRTQAMTVLHREGSVPEHAKSMVLRDPGTLIGRVWVTGAPVLSNDPKSDWRYGSPELPPSHPELKAFMGVPVFAGRSLVAMVGLANAPDGYTMSDVRMLEPMLGTVCQLVLAWRNDLERKRSNERLRATSAQLAERTSVLQATLDSVIQGILFVDANGFIRLFNHRLAELLELDESILAKHPPIAEVVELQKRRGDFGAQYELVSENARDHVSRFEYSGVPERYMRRSVSGRILEVISHVLPDGGMVRTFTDVTSHVESTEAVQALNATLERRVAERTAELEQSLKDLEVISYSIAHDLRAPLRAVNGFSTIIQEEESSHLSDSGREMFRRIQNSAANMGQMITDMLELMRVVQADLQPAPVDMQELAYYARDSLHSYSPDAVVEVGQLPMALGDATFLRQVLINLLDNALKYSKHLDTPEIRIGFDESRQAFYVRDNGMGFDMSRAQKLFGLFQRLHAGSGVPGTGVGLAIVSRIVERHGGRIWAESEKGKGTTFWWTLPLA